LYALWREKRIRRTMLKEHLNLRTLGNAVRYAKLFQDVRDENDRGLYSRDLGNKIPDQQMINMYKYIAFYAMINARQDGFYREAHEIIATEGIKTDVKLLQHG